MNDRQLLRRFVKQNSQEAFACLTERYLGLVYSVCRRELDDAEAAEDVTQAVFLLLARKAPTLGRSVVLSGWLFQTARFAARNARTQAGRRAAYEQQAAAERGRQAVESEDAAWSGIEPLLNRSLAALGEAERECVLLRFFQGMTFAEAGAALGLSEEAARKRLTRALEKMRRFFGKEGVIVPGVALAALLSAHAAKAVPMTCQAGMAAITSGVLAGHLHVGLAGSHVFHLSEGAWKAMKIAQMKLTAGLAATVAVGIGLTTYAVAKGVVPLVTRPHAVSPLLSLPKPGHVLAQAGLTAPQIAARCRDAYGALQTYQGTTEVSSHSVTLADGVARDYHSSAAIRFVRPGKIRADGTDMSGNPFAYVSDGTATALQTNTGPWKKIENPEMAIASVTGIAQSAATTVPALLLHTNWGNPFTSGYDPEVREDAVDGHPCYVVIDSLVSAKSTQAGTFWVDEKTFLLRRYVSENETQAQTLQIAGTEHDLPAIRMRTDERFTNERLNGPLPDSTFTLPATE